MRKCGKTPHRGGSLNRGCVFAPPPSPRRSCVACEEGHHEVISLLAEAGAALDTPKARMLHTRGVLSFNDYIILKMEIIHVF